MIVLLTEEQSMGECLKVIIPRLWPDSMQGINWHVLSFQGKSHLRDSIPKKIEGWNYGNPHFIILQKNDGGDYAKIKQKLCDIACQCGKPFYVRIVCQEMESWLLGDLKAIRQAYPQARIRVEAKFHNPDRLENPSQEIERLINTQAKVQRAKRISQYLDLTQNKSKSFGVFITTLKQLIQEEQSKLEK